MFRQAQHDNLEIKLTKQKRLGEIQEDLERYQESPQGKLL